MVQLAWRVQGGGQGVRMQAAFDVGNLRRGFREGAGMLQAVKSDLQIVGGPNGTADILVYSPWQGERAEAVLLYVTSWGNTAANILYVNADSANALMGAGAATLSQPTNGGVYVINGAGTIDLSHQPLGVTQFLRVSPTAASNGQIYLGFFWQKVLDLAAPKLMTPPERTPEQEMSEENETWRRLKGLPPAEYLKQNPGQLTAEQQRQLKQAESLTDMRKRLNRPIEPIGRFNK